MFNYIIANKERFTHIIYFLYCLKNGVEFPIELSVDNDELNSQLRSQLYSQLDSQLRSQLYSQLDSRIDSQLNSQLRSRIDSQLRSQLYSQLDSQLRSQLNSQLYLQLRLQLHSQLDSQLDLQLNSQLDSQLYSRIDSQLDSQLNSQLDSQLYSQLNKYNNAYLWTSNIWSNAYLSWWKFIKDEFNIQSQIGVDLDSWNDLYLKSGVYSAIFSELLCVVCKYPKKIHVNSLFDMHSVGGQSVEWGALTDNTLFNCYYIRGVYIDPELYAKISAKEYTFEEFVKEGNEEVKSAILAFFEEKFGNEYLFRFLSTNLKELDTYTNKKDAHLLEGTTGGMNIGVYTLFKGSVNGIKLAFIRCYCPSSDRMFFLSIDPANNNAKDGIASLYRVPRKLATEIKYINRQGERFSTVFTQKGKEAAKQLTDQEISDLVPISGDRYFSLMKYEF